MELDLVSHVALVEKVGRTTLSTPTKEAIVFSLTILMRDYRMSSLKIVAIIKCLNSAEYVIIKSGTTFFITQDGKFWSPLPVLSAEESLILHCTGYGLLSPHPFTGDPSVQIHENLTELHRVSNLIYYLDSIALLPKGAWSQGQRFNGLSADEAEQFSSYEPCQPEHQPELNSVDLAKLEQLSAQNLHSCTVGVELAKQFQFLTASTANDWTLASDPYRRFTTFSHKYWSGLTSYVYWKSRVYGWVFAAGFSLNTGLYRLADVLFVTRCPGFVPADEAARQRALEEAEAKVKAEEDAVFADREARRLAKEEKARLRAEKARLRQERREAKEQARIAAEEAAAAEAAEGDEDEEKPEDGVEAEN